MQKYEKVAQILLKIRKSRKIIDRKYEKVAKLVRVRKSRRIGTKKSQNVKMRKSRRKKYENVAELFCDFFVPFISLIFTN